MFILGNDRKQPNRKCHFNACKCCDDVAGCVLRVTGGEAGMKSFVQLYDNSKAEQRWGQCERHGRRIHGRELGGELGG